MCYVPCAMWNIRTPYSHESALEALHLLHWNSLRRLREEYTPWRVLHHSHSRPVRTIEQVLCYLLLAAPPDSLLGRGVDPPTTALYLVTLQALKMWGNFRVKLWQVRVKLWQVRVKLWHVRVKLWQIRVKLWQVRVKLWQVRVKLWQVRVKLWQVRIKLWQVRVKLWQVRVKLWQVRVKLWQVRVKLWQVRVKLWQVWGESSYLICSRELSIGPTNWSYPRLWQVRVKLWQVRVKLWQVRVEAVPCFYLFPKQSLQAPPAPLQTKWSKIIEMTKKDNKLSIWTKTQTPAWLEATISDHCFREIAIAPEPPSNAPDLFMEAARAVTDWDVMPMRVGTGSG